MERLALQHMDRTVAALTRRNILKGAAATGAMLVAGGCSGGDAGGAKGEIRFLHNETDPPSVAFFKKAISAYESSHSGVKVNMELVSTDGRLQRLKSLQAARQMPGVFKIVPEERYDFAQQGVVVSVDDVVADIGKDKFVDGALVPINGKVYDIPYTINQFSVYFYRQDLLQKLDLAPATDWKGLAAGSKRLTGDRNKDGQTDIYGTVIPAGLNRMCDIFFAQIFWSHGGTFFDEDFKVALDRGDAGSAALETIASLAPSCPPGIAAYSYSDMVSTYLTGKVAQDVYAPRMIANLADQAPQLLDGTLAGPLLVGDSGAGIGYANPNSFAISAAKFGNENIDGARDFLHFITSAQQVRDFALTAYPHMIPPLKDVQVELLKSQSAAGKISQPIAERSFDLTNTMDFTTEAGASVQGSALHRTGLFNPQSPLISSRQIGAQMVQDVLIHKTPPRDALRKGAESLRSAIKESA